jgi:hypothetical protein
VNFPDNYNPDRGTAFRSRQVRMHEPDFHAESDELMKMMDGWAKIDYDWMVKIRVRRISTKYQCKQTYPPAP